MSHLAALAPKSARNKIRHLFIIGGLVFLASLVAMAPASILGSVLKSNAPELSYSNVSGTVWRGAFSGLSVSGFDLGDVRYRTKSLALATGKLKANIELQGGALQGGADAVALGAGQRTEVEGARGVFNLSAIGRYKLLGAPMSGNVRFDIDALRFSPGGCLEARGEISTDILDLPLTRLGRAPLPLAGTIQCDGEKLRAILSGVNDDGEMRLDISVTPALEYGVTVFVRSDKRDVIQAFEALGFENAGGELRYDSFGDFQL